MRKVLLILLFLGQNVLGQEYSFDNYYEYKSTTIGTRFFMVNSQDNGYFFIGTSNAGGFSGCIVDLNRKENHFYIVSNSIDTIDFDYYDSLNWKDKFKPQTEPEIQYEFSAKTTDSIHYKKIVIKNKVTPKGKKRFRGKVEFTCEKNDFVFHPNLMKFFANHFFDGRDVSHLGNLLPINLVIDYNNGSLVTFDLTKKEKIDTLLSLSKEQIKYRQ